MLLTVDIGNTNILFGLFDKDNLIFEARLSSDKKRTEDQYAVELFNITSIKKIRLSDISGSIISSVVPELTNVIKNAIFNLTGVNSMVLGPGIKSGLNIKIDNPAQLGADLVAGAVAAIDRFELPCLIIDLGTATKISVVDKDGVYRGCVISPGVGISLNALAEHASLLPSVNIAVKDCQPFGTNTVTSMQAGLIIGTAAMLDGMCDRIECALGQSACSIISTGGLADYIVPHCKHSIINEPHLLLHGLRLIYNKNN